MVSKSYDSLWVICFGDICKLLKFITIMNGFSFFIQAVRNL